MPGLRKYCGNLANRTTYAVPITGCLTTIGDQNNTNCTNLNMLAPRIVKLLQAALTEYPDWEIIAAVALERKSWPEMGLTIRAHEIIDNLQRQYFPKEFQAIAYNENPLG
jgi:hypothetical protein